jgi:hypothetical protein
MTVTKIIYRLEINSRQAAYFDDIIKLFIRVTPTVKPMKTYFIAISIRVTTHSCSAKYT